VTEIVEHDNDGSSKLHNTT